MIIRTFFVSLLLLGLPCWTLTVNFPALTTSLREPSWRAYLSPSSRQTAGSLTFDAPPSSAACQFRLSHLTPFDRKASRQLISLIPNSTWTIWPTVSMAACNHSSSPCLFTADRSAIKVNLREIRQIDRIGSWALRNRTINFRSEPLDSRADVSCVHFETLPGDHCRLVQRAAWCSRATPPRTDVTTSHFRPSNGPYALSLKRRKLHALSKQCEANLLDAQSSAWLGKWNPGRSTMTYVASVTVQQKLHQCLPSIDIPTSIKDSMIEDATHLVIEGLTTNEKIRVHPILQPPPEGDAVVMTTPPSCFAFANMTTSRDHHFIALDVLYLCNKFLKPHELAFQLSDSASGVKGHVFFTAPITDRNGTSHVQLPLPVKEISRQSRIQILLGEMAFTVPLPISLMDKFIDADDKTLKTTFALKAYDFHDANPAFGSIEGMLRVTFDSSTSHDEDLEYFLRVDDERRSTWYRPLEPSMTIEESHTMTFAISPAVSSGINREVPALIFAVPRERASPLTLFLSGDSPADPSSGMAISPKFPLRDRDGWSSLMSLTEVRFVDLDPQALHLAGPLRFTRSMADEVDDELRVTVAYVSDEASTHLTTFQVELDCSMNSTLVECPLSFSLTRPPGEGDHLRVTLSTDLASGSVPLRTAISDLNFFAPVHGSASFVDEDPREGWVSGELHYKPDEAVWSHPAWHAEKIELLAVREETDFHKPRVIQQLGVADIASRAGNITFPIHSLRIDDATAFVLVARSSEVDLSAASVVLPVADLHFFPGALCHRRDVTLLGDSLPSSHKNDTILSDCQTSCEESAACQAWIWDSGVCHLKERVWLDAKQSGAISGRKQCESPPAGADNSVLCRWLFAKSNAAFLESAQGRIIPSECTKQNEAVRFQLNDPQTNATVSLSKSVSDAELPALQDVTVHATKVTRGDDPRRRKISRTISFSTVPNSATHLRAESLTVCDSQVMHSETTEIPVSGLRDQKLARRTVVLKVDSQPLWPQARRNCKQITRLALSTPLASICGPVHSLETMPVDSSNEPLVVLPDSLRPSTRRESTPRLSDRAAYSEDAAAIMSPVIKKFVIRRQPASMSSLQESLATLELETANDDVEISVSSELCSALSVGRSHASGGDGDALRLSSSWTLFSVNTTHCDLKIMIANSAADLLWKRVMDVPVPEENEVELSIERRQIQMKHVDDDPILGSIDGLFWLNFDKQLDSDTSCRLYARSQRHPETQEMMVDSLRISGGVTEWSSRLPQPLLTWSDRGDIGSLDTLFLECSDESGSRVHEADRAIFDWAGDRMDQGVRQVRLTHSDAIGDVEWEFGDYNFYYRFDLAGVVKRLRHGAPGTFDFRVQVTPRDEPLLDAFLASEISVRAHDRIEHKSRLDLCDASTDLNRPGAFIVNCPYMQMDYLSSIKDAFAISTQDKGYQREWDLVLLHRLSNGRAIVLDRHTIVDNSPFWRLGYREMELGLDIGSYWAQTPFLSQPERWDGHKGRGRIAHCDRWEDLRSLTGRECVMTQTENLRPYNRLSETQVTFDAEGHRNQTIFADTKVGGTNARAGDVYEAVVNDRCFEGFILPESLERRPSLHRYPNSLSPSETFALKAEDAGWLTELSRRITPGVLDVENESAELNRCRSFCTTQAGCLLYTMAYSHCRQARCLLDTPPTSGEIICQAFGLRDFAIKGDPLRDLTLFEVSPHFSRTCSIAKSIPMGRKRTLINFVETDMRRGHFRGAVAMLELQRIDNGILGYDIFALSATNSAARYVGFMERPREDFGEDTSSKYIPVALSQHVEWNALETDRLLVMSRVSSNSTEGTIDLIDIRDNYIAWEASDYADRVNGLPFEALWALDINDRVCLPVTSSAQARFYGKFNDTWTERGMACSLTGMPTPDMPDGVVRLLEFEGGEFGFPDFAPVLDYTERLKKGDAAVAAEHTHLVRAAAPWQVSKMAYDTKQIRQRTRRPHPPRVDDTVDLEAKDPDRVWTLESHNLDVLQTRDLRDIADRQPPDRDGYGTPPFEKFARISNFDFKRTLLYTPPVLFIRRPIDNGVISSHPTKKTWEVSSAVLQTAQDGTGQVYQSLLICLDSLSSRQTDEILKIRVGTETETHPITLSTKTPCITSSVAAADVGSIQLCDSDNRQCKALELDGHQSLTQSGQHDEIAEGAPLPWISKQWFHDYRSDTLGLTLELVASSALLPADLRVACIWEKDGEAPPLTLEEAHSFWSSELSAWKHRLFFGPIARSREEEPYLEVTIGGRALEAEPEASYSSGDDEPADELQCLYQLVSGDLHPHKKKRLFAVEGHVSAMSQDAMQSRPLIADLLEAKVDDWEGQRCSFSGFISRPLRTAYIDAPSLRQITCQCVGTCHVDEDAFSTLRFVPSQSRFVNLEVRTSQVSGPLTLNLLGQPLSDTITITCFWELPTPSGQTELAQLADSFSVSFQVDRPEIVLEIPPGTKRVGMADVILCQLEDNGHVVDTIRVSLPIETRPSPREARQSSFPDLLKLDLASDRSLVNVSSIAPVLVERRESDQTPSRYLVHCDASADPLSLFGKAGARDICVGGGLQELSLTGLVSDSVLSRRALPLYRLGAPSALDSLLQDGGRAEEVSSSVGTERTIEGMETSLIWSSQSATPRLTIFLPGYIAKRLKRLSVREVRQDGRVAEQQLNLQLKLVCPVNPMYRQAPPFLECPIESLDGGSRYLVDLHSSRLRSLSVQVATDERQFHIHRRDVARQNAPPGRSIRVSDTDPRPFWLKPEVIFTAPKDFRLSDVKVSVKTLSNPNPVHLREDEYMTQLQDSDGTLKFSITRPIYLREPAMLELEPFGMVVDAVDLTNARPAIIKAVSRVKDDYYIYFQTRAKLDVSAELYELSIDEEVITQIKLYQSEKEHEYYLRLPANPLNHVLKLRRSLPANNLRQVQFEIDTRSLSFDELIEWEPPRLSTEQSEACSSLQWQVNSTAGLAFEGVKSSGNRHAIIFEEVDHQMIARSISPMQGSILELKPFEKLALLEWGSLRAEVCSPRADSKEIDAPPTADPEDVSQQALRLIPSFKTLLPIFSNESVITCSLLQRSLREFVMDGWGLAPWSAAFDWGEIIAELPGTLVQSTRKLCRVDLKARPESGRLWTLTDDADAFTQVTGYLDALTSPADCLPSSRSAILRLSTFFSTKGHEVHSIPNKLRRLAVVLGDRSLNDANRTDNVCVSSPRGRPIDILGRAGVPDAVCDSARRSLHSLYGDLARYELTHVDETSSFRLDCDTLKGDPQIRPLEEQDSRHADASSARVGSLAEYFDANGDGSITTQELESRMLSMRPRSQAAVKVLRELIEAGQDASSDGGGILRHVVEHRLAKLARLNEAERYAALRLNLPGIWQVENEESLSEQQPMTANLAAHATWSGSREIDILYRDPLSVSGEVEASDCQSFLRGPSWILPLAVCEVDASRLRIVLPERMPHILEHLWTTSRQTLRIRRTIRHNLVRAYTTPVDSETTRIHLLSLAPHAVLEWRVNGDVLASASEGGDLNEVTATISAALRTEPMEIRARLADGSVAVAASKESKDFPPCSVALNYAATVTEKVRIGEDEPLCFERANSETECCTAHPSPASHEGLVKSVITSPTLPSDDSPAYLSTFSDLIMSGTAFVRQRRRALDVTVALADDSSAKEVNVKLALQQGGQLFALQSVVADVRYSSTSGVPLKTQSILPMWTDRELHLLSLPQPGQLLLVICGDVIDCPEILPLPRDLAGVHMMTIPARGSLFTPPQLNLNEASLNSDHIEFRLDDPFCNDADWLLTHASTGIAMPSGPAVNVWPLLSSAPIRIEPSNCAKGNPSAILLSIPRTTRALAIASLLQAPAEEDRALFYLQSPAEPSNENGHMTLSELTILINALQTQNRHLAVRAFRNEKTLGYHLLSSHFEPHSIDFRQFLITALAPAASHSQSLIAELAAEPLVLNEEETAASTLRSLLALAHDLAAIDQMPRYFDSDFGLFELSAKPSPCKAAQAIVRGSFTQSEFQGSAVSDIADHLAVDSLSPHLVLGSGFFTANKCALEETVHLKAGALLRALDSTTTTLTNRGEAKQSKKPYIPRKLAARDLSEFLRVVSADEDGQLAFSDCELDSTRTQLSKLESADDLNVTMKCQAKPGSHLLYFDGFEYLSRIYPTRFPPRQKAAQGVTWSFILCLLLLISSIILLLSRWRDGVVGRHERRRQRADGFDGTFEGALKVCPQLYAEHLLPSEVEFLDARANSSWKSRILSFFAPSPSLITSAARPLHSAEDNYYSALVNEMQEHWADDESDVLDEFFAFIIEDHISGGASNGRPDMRSRRARVVLLAAEAMALAHRTYPWLMRLSDTILEGHTQDPESTALELYQTHSAARKDVADLVSKMMAETAGLGEHDGAASDLDEAGSVTAFLPALRPLGFFKVGVRRSDCDDVVVGAYMWIGPDQAELLFVAESEVINHFSSTNIRAELFLHGMPAHGLICLSLLDLQVALAHVVIDDFEDPVQCVALTVSSTQEGYLVFVEESQVPHQLIEIERLIKASVECLAVQVADALDSCLAQEGAEVTPVVLADALCNPLERHRPSHSLIDQAECELMPTPFHSIPCLVNQKYFSNIFCRFCEDTQELRLAIQCQTLPPPQPTHLWECATADTTPCSYNPSESGQHFYPPTQSLYSTSTAFSRTCQNETPLLACTAPAPPKVPEPLKGAATCPTMLPPTTLGSSKHSSTVAVNDACPRAAPQSSALPQSKLLYAANDPSKFIAFLDFKPLPDPRVLSWGGWNPGKQTQWINIPLREITDISLNDDSQQVGSGEVLRLLYSCQVDLTLADGNVLTLGFASPSIALQVYASFFEASEVLQAMEEGRRGLAEFEEGERSEWAALARTASVDGSLMYTAVQCEDFESPQCGPPMHKMFTAPLNETGTSIGDFRNIQRRQTMPGSVFMQANSKTAPSVHSEAGLETMPIDSGMTQDHEVAALLRDRHNFIVDNGLNLGLVRKVAALKTACKSSPMELLILYIGQLSAPLSDHTDPLHLILDKRNLTWTHEALMSLPLCGLVTAALIWWLPLFTQTHPLWSLNSAAILSSSLVAVSQKLLKSSVAVQQCATWASLCQLARSWSNERLTCQLCWAALVVSSTAVLGIVVCRVCSSRAIPAFSKSIFAAVLLSLLFSWLVVPLVRASAAILCFMSWRNGALLVPRATFRPLRRSLQQVCLLPPHTRATVPAPLPLKEETNPTLANFTSLMKSGSEGDEISFDERNPSRFATVGCCSDTN